MNNVRWIAVGAVALGLAACEDPSVTAADAAPKDSTLAPVYLAEPGKAVEGRYMVFVEKDQSVPAVISEHQLDDGTQQIRLLNGFVTNLDAEGLLAFRKDSRVKYIEQDQVVRASKVQTIAPNGPWGLDRIDQENRGLSGTYTYSRKGAAVKIWLVDTGIDATNTQFLSADQSNRVKVVGWVTPTFTDGNDCNGHGTHVAGTVAGRTFGVAKEAHIYSLRVLDCNGEGFVSDINIALDYAGENTLGPSVANISLGGSMSKSLNEMVDLLSQFMLVVVAAGNDKANSCIESPAGAVGAFTVAAVDSTDRRASFSNWGRCVDMYAPGVGIRSAKVGGGSLVLDGTSMAAPHVAGVAALYLERVPSATPQQVENWLLNNAVAGKVRANDPNENFYGTPNLLLNKRTL